MTHCNSNSNNSNNVDREQAFKVILLWRLGSGLTSLPKRLDFHFRRQRPQGWPSEQGEESAATRVPWPLLDTRYSLAYQLITDLISQLLKPPGARRIKKFLLAPLLLFSPHLPANMNTRMLWCFGAERP